MARTLNDIDGDGRVSREEFPAHTAVRLGRVDRNGDGVVTTADSGSC